MAETQLTLALGGRERYRREDFLEAPSNAAARQWLAHPDTWPRGRLILFGPAGCGKTHLARGWAGPAPVWVGGDLPTLSAVAQAGRIVVDEADAADEAALFHLINACEAVGGSLLLTGTVPPVRWGTGLADLASRLLASQSVEIGAAEDVLLKTLLARLLAERQIVVGAQTREWLLTRLPRTAGAIGQAVALLDAASLARQQAVTRGLARAALGDLLRAEEI